MKGKREQRPVLAQGTERSGQSGESQLKEKGRRGRASEALPPPSLTGCSPLEAGAAAASGRRSCPASPRSGGPSTAVAPDPGCGLYATGHSGGVHPGRTPMSLPGGDRGRQLVSHSHGPGPQAGKSRWQRKSRWAGEQPEGLPHPLPPGSQPPGQIHGKLGSHSRGGGWGGWEGAQGSGESGQLPDLELQPRLGDSPEGRGLPVRLLGLLPHDHVEAAAVLVAEDKARVVVVRHRVHVEGAFEVHTVEGCVSWVWVGSTSGPAELPVAHCGPGVGWDACRACGQLGPHRPPLEDSCVWKLLSWASLTYQLPGRGHCSWSERFPCPGGVQ